MADHPTGDINAAVHRFEQLDDVVSAISEADFAPSFAEVNSRAKLEIDAENSTVQTPSAPVRSVSVPENGVLMEHEPTKEDQSSTANVSIDLQGPSAIVPNESKEQTQRYMMFGCIVVVLIIVTGAVLIVHFVTDANRDGGNGNPVVNPRPTITTAPVAPVVSDTSMTPSPTNFPATVSSSPVASTLEPAPSPITPSPSTPSPVTTAPVLDSLTATPGVSSGFASTTLSAIIQKGEIKCGVLENLVGFSQRNASAAYGYQGFDVDLCKAIAAAIFGPDFGTRLTVIATTTSDRFNELKNATFDVLAGFTTHTMERDVHERSASAGFSFSSPYMYDLVHVGGQRQFVECADRLDRNLTTCGSLAICVLDSTTYKDTFEELFPSQVKTAPSLDTLYQRLGDGTCNVVAAGQFATSRSIVPPTISSFDVGNRTFAREPVALVTRDDDASWSDFVNWIMIGLMRAEEKGINMAAANTFDVGVDPFGPETRLSFMNALTAVGNYAEMYGRHLEALVPRQPINMINRENDVAANNTPLVMSLPFGAAATTVGPTADVVNSTIARIRANRKLRCGVRQNQPGFSTVENGVWSGMDVDYCNAVSAAIFDGFDSDKVEYIIAPAQDRFSMLQNGQVDVLCRTTTRTMVRDVDQPSVRAGFSFSPTTFYDGTGFGGIPPFRSCADNQRTTGDCVNLKICVAEGTTTIKIVQSLFADQYIVLKATVKQALEGLSLFDCNVVAATRNNLTPGFVRTVAGYDGDYEQGLQSFSKEPLTPLTRQDDPQFSALMFWVVVSTIYAEENGITQATASNMTNVLLFGENVRMFEKVIETVGNYGEIYDRNLQALVPRTGHNLLNTMNGPQLFVPSFV